STMGRMGRRTSQGGERSTPEKAGGAGGAAPFGHGSPTKVEESEKEQEEYERYRDDMDAGNYTDPETAAGANAHASNATRDATARGGITMHP
ncbi:UNVERIFIED_CONTAM: hypothetical protein NY603_23730, partial [Bacteroidetes bacterium 56_B9]